MEFFEEFAAGVFAEYENNSKTTQVKKDLMSDLTHTYSNYRSNLISHDQAVKKTIADFATTTKYTDNLLLKSTESEADDISFFQAYFAFFRSTGLIFTLIAIIMYLGLGHLFDLWTKAWIILPVAFITDRLLIIYNKFKR